jgi:hypothetical protein
LALELSVPLRRPLCCPTRTASMTQKVVDRTLDHEQSPPAAHHEPHSLANTHSIINHHESALSMATSPSLSIWPICCTYHPQLLSCLATIVRGVPPSP